MYDVFSYIVLGIIYTDECNEYIYIFTMALHSLKPSNNNNNNVDLLKHPFLVNILLC